MIRRAGDDQLEDRTLWITAREIAVAKRDQELAEREELLQLRERALDARSEADDARAEREHLLGQVRAANEKLVTAIVEAEQLADEANAARAQADHNEERFRSLVYTSSAIVWQATSSGRVQVDRDAWRRFTGVDPGAGDWGWLEAVHANDQGRVRDAWAEAVATATPYSCQHQIRARAGGYASVVARAVPIPATGTVREWIGMITDVTDRVRVEQARELFIGILGHDLRNPLSAILMGVELLGDLAGPEASIVARIARSANRIEVMIRDLLDFARGRLAGGIPVAPRRCDLRALCNEAVAEMTQAHPERAIRFEAHGHLHGQWDPDRVEQVVSNLIGNAIAHGVGAIGLVACDEGDEVVITVHNEGAAIPAAMLATLFEPFTARDLGGAPAKRVGLGLGLYIASEIVHAHGGTISVDSAEGTGTTFTLRLPRAVRPRQRTTTQRDLVLGPSS